MKCYLTKGSCNLQVAALALCLFPTLAARQRRSRQSSHDCKSLPTSMNGGSKPPGCPGAVYQNDNPSWKYCAGLGDDGSDVIYPWWKECCDFAAGACVPKPDCSTPPVSMNGAAFGTGCAGAKYQDGSFSWKYCGGKGNDGKLKPEYHWWAECCTFSSNQCTDKPVTFLQQFAQ
eukprot:TRINITY_DN3140_c0_g1_i1.p1 TRINITY_DN3140_c0_g1~~TRINITY_DN3140_c0_g1_i1.p1  ORF type:complete len:174 (+),score=25.13 TRINITY_DN3140_c0_g1_i1:54-575(+)